MPARLPWDLRRIAVLAIVLGAAARSVDAAPVPHGLYDYTVTTWNESHGLAAGRISVIEQDADGYLWIGSDAGLVRFDGVRFEAVGGFVEARPPYEPVTAILSARDRSLWIGTGRNGIVRRHVGGVTTYGEPEGFLGFVNSLLEDRAGTVWAGTSRGLFKFDGERWSAAGGRVPGEVPVLAMLEDRAGRFWVATREVVLRRDAPGGPLVVLGRIPTSSNIWQAFSEDADGVVWMTDFGAGFRRASDEAPRRAQPSGWGVRLVSDRRGNLWVATRGQGLWRVRPEKGRHAPPDVITVRDGLANDAVQTVFEDREGNIWVGTNAGLQRLTPHRVMPLTDLPVARAAVAMPDGSVWVGSTAGLIGVTPGGRVRFTPEQGLPGIVVLSLAAHPRGGLWVATERTLARFSDGRFTPVLDVGGDQRIFSIAAADGAVWLRNVSLRLRRISEEGKDLPLDGIPEPFLSRTFTLSTDRAGRLWFGATSGDVGVREPGGSFRSFSPGIGSIATVFEDASGTTWVGGDQGLGRLDGDRFVVVKGGGDFPSGVSSIAEDAGGALWLGVRHGIARVEKAEFARAASSPDHLIRHRLFNSADGAAGIPLSSGGRTSVRTTDGRLWFTTSGGLTVIDPSTIGDPRPSVPVKVVSVFADTTEFKPSADLRLPARTAHVQFAFTALTLTDATRAQIQYRLEGQDQDWMDAGTSRQTSYTNLPPGRYRFLVRGRNGDASWSEPGAALDFWIQPTFYQTRWFYVLSFLAVCSLLYATWRLNARRVRGQFALVLAERIRMSRAIHDTLLQGLAGLALQLDDLSHGIDAPSPKVKDRVLSMRRRVEEYIREARQSIWDLRSPAAESKPLPEALRDVGLRAINGRPIAFEFATTGTPKACSPAVQEQLLRICQEAVTNAVRHGHPGRVDVELEYSRDSLRVRVSDDGCGFEPTHLNGDHYGVVSMRERAGQVRGRLTIASTPDGGTQVETVVPRM